VLPQKRLARIFIWGPALKATHFLASPPAVTHPGNFRYVDSGKGTEIEVKGKGTEIEVKGTEVFLFVFSFSGPFLCIKRTVFTTRLREGVEDGKNAQDKTN